MCSVYLHSSFFSLIRTHWTQTDCQHSTHCSRCLINGLICRPFCPVLYSFNKVLLCCCYSSGKNMRKRIAESSLEAARGWQITSVIAVWEPLLLSKCLWVVCMTSVLVPSKWWGVSVWQGLKEESLHLYDHLLFSDDDWLWVVVRAA